jgi:SAM-dependent methyltransferase
MRALEDKHWWYRSLRSVVLRRLGKAQRILDVGCGTGGMFDLVHRRGVVGIDVSETALGYARGRGLSRVARACACALPFPAASFDLVLALDVIYHRAVPDDAVAIAECARVLRPGGTVMIHAPAYRWLSGAHDRAVHGARRYTRGRVRQLAAAAGLEIGELTYRNAVALPFAVALRTVRRNTRRPGEGLPPSDLRPLPLWLNAALSFVSRAESAILDVARLPAGLSVWCVARKPA